MTPVAVSAVVCGVTVVVVFYWMRRRKSRAAAIPKTFRALVATAPSVLEVQTFPIPTLTPGEVLIRVYAAPVNPSDLGHIKGTYGMTKEQGFPLRCGFEGSGLVVASGGGLMANLMVGRRVAFAVRTGGTWGEYVVAKGLSLFPLPGDVDWAAGCSAIVNPWTVTAFLEIARAGRHSTIINTAGASALGQMLVKQGARMGIRVVSIVRRQAQVEVLTNVIPEAKVLVSAEPDFEDQLRNLAAETPIKLAFDAIGGDSSAMLLKNLPTRSTVYVYGSLSKESISGLPNGDFVSENKTLTGFHLNGWLGSGGLGRLLGCVRTVRRDLSTTLKTTYGGRFNLDDAAAGIEEYQKQMTGGKALLVLHEDVGSL